MENYPAPSAAQLLTMLLHREHFCSYKYYTQFSETVIWDSVNLQSDLKQCLFSLLPKGGIKPRYADKQTAPKRRTSSRSFRFLWVNHFSCGIEESFQGSNYCITEKVVCFFLRVYIAQKLSYKEKSLRLL